jgi:hypothetical protein
MYVDTYLIKIQLTVLPKTVTVLKSENYFCGDNSTHNERQVGKKMRE